MSLTILWRGWSNLKYVLTIAYKPASGEVFKKMLFLFFGFKNVVFWSRDLPHPIALINLNPNLD